MKSKWDDENAGPIRAFAWPLIVQAGGLAQLSGSKLQLTKAGRNALAQPAGETLHRLWSKWIDTTILDELSRIECIKGQTGKGKRGLTAVSSRRDAIADTLAECPAGSWISADEFHRFVCASGNDFTVSRNAWDLYICEKQYGSLGYEGGEQILDERYLLAFLLEYAATLGVIDVALIPPAGARYNYGGLWGTDELVYFSRYDGLMYFRITALGASCVEERIPMNQERRMEYALANRRAQFRIAAENPAKMTIQFTLYHLLIVVVDRITRLPRSGVQPEVERILREAGAGAGARA